MNAKEQARLLNIFEELRREDILCEQEGESHTRHTHGAIPLKLPPLWRVLCEKINSRKHKEEEKSDYYVVINNLDSNSECITCW